MRRNAGPSSALTYQETEPVVDEGAEGADGVGPGQVQGDEPRVGHLELRLGADVVHGAGGKQGGQGLLEQSIGG